MHRFASDYDNVDQEKMYYFDTILNISFQAE